MPEPQEIGPVLDTVLIETYLRKLHGTPKERAAYELLREYRAEARAAVAALRENLRLKLEGLLRPDLLQPGQNGAVGVRPDPPDRQ